MRIVFVRFKDSVPGNREIAIRVDSIVGVRSCVVGTPEENCSEVMTSWGSWIVDGKVSEVMEQVMRAYSQMTSPVVPGVGGLG